MADITRRIIEFNRHRDPEKVLLKYKAIRESSFRFLRGTCHLFYEDLGHQYTLPTSPNCWLCGDLHLENFGSFIGFDGQEYFDINDFDEAILGPALFDLSRLLVSVRVACNNSGYERSYTDTLLDIIITGYCKTLHAAKPVTVENETATGFVKELLDKVAGRKEKKLVKGKADKAAGYKKLLIDNKKTFSLPAPFKKELVKNIQSYFDERAGKNLHKIHDAVYMIAGTGSIGAKRYLVLATDNSTGKKYLLVMKQSNPSSLQPYVKTKQPAWSNEAQRIHRVQFRMQHLTPGELSTHSFDNEWYIIKWVQPEEDKINPIDFSSNKKNQLKLMDTIGVLAASAQLRSGGRDGSAIADEMIRFASELKWVEPLLAFAEAYAAQVEKDYEDYCAAYDKGVFNVTVPKK